MDEWDDEETVRRLLEEAGPRPPIPPEDLDAIASAARFAWRRQVGSKATPLPRRRPQALVAALAAALALAAGLAWWWASRGPSEAPVVARVEAVRGPVHLEPGPGIAPGEPIPAGAVLRSGEAGRASLRLGNGTAVRLDVETRVRFTSAAVLELERGAVYVDTRSGSLEIRTPGGTVRDLGTRFAVRIGDSGETIVRVRDGAVLTEQRDRTYVTRAGQELVLHRDGTSESRGVAPHGSGWEWILEASAGFDVEGRSLKEFLDWVSSETGWRIVLADERLAERAAGIVLHGSIGDLRADQAPFAVLPGAGFEGELRDGTLIVRFRNPR